MPPLLHDFTPYSPKLELEEPGYDPLVAAYYCKGFEQVRELKKVVSGLCRHAVDGP
jgi:hypothetical protein